METSSHFAAAEARARSLELGAPAEVALEELRTRCLTFHRRAPQAPTCRRADDPARKQAKELLPQAQELLAGTLRLSQELGSPSAKALAELMRAELEALWQIAQGGIAEAEAASRRAQELGHAAARVERSYRRSDEARLPVYDQASGVSRFDPRTPATLVAKLSCPWPACRHSESYRLEPERATHQLTCPRCQRPFVAYFGELRSLELERSPGRSRYRFRLRELSGELARLELHDWSGASFSVVEGDLLAFLYAPRQQLQGVLNLDTSRVLWLQRGGSCFLASAVFGESAPELQAFRAFRDRVLLASPLGRALVRGYYRVGPLGARCLRRHPPALALSRRVLQAVHLRLVKGGFS